MRTILCLFVIMNFLGCTHPVRPETRNFDTTAPGIVQTRKVGEPLFEKGTVEVAPGFRAKRDSHVPIMEHLLFPFIKRGDMWVCEVQLEDGNYGCSTSEDLREAVETDKGIRVVDDVPLFIISPKGEFRGLYDNGRIVRLDGYLQGLFEPVEVPMENMSRQELIYNGKQAESIRLVYNEFSRDPTKPKLKEKLEFDIASLNVIQVKSLIIEVLDASDSSISYLIKN